MGCCCSTKGEDEGPAVSEAEMREQELANRKVLSVAKAMSAPSIKVQDYNTVRGCSCSCVDSDYGRLNVFELSTFIPFDNRHPDTV